MFIKKQLHDKNLQKVRQQREQEANKVLEKIAQVEERLGNIESSNFLIDKRAREEDKRRKLREAFEQKEQNQKRLDQLLEEKNQQIVLKEQKVNEIMEKKKRGL